MFWADRLIEEIGEKFKNKIDSKKPLVVRDEKSASGRVHVGSLRGVAIHGLISEILKEKGISDSFLFEINDFDSFDNLPVYLDAEKFSPFLGKPLFLVPSPDGKAENYAEYFGQEFINVIKELGFSPEFYRLRETYKSGKFNDLIRTAFEKADEIREIYRRISGSIKEEGWFPFNVICENCQKIATTRITSFDGEKVDYVCEENSIEWTKGCGFKGKISPFDANGKLPWKVEWAAKFKLFGVDAEGAGKDHSTKGGAREVADAICREVFDHEPPFNVPYEFFHVGGRKMSSSKGSGSSSREIADLLPPELLRFLLINKEPKKVIDFEPEGDTIPVLYDLYDEMADFYFRNEKSDYSRIFYLVHTPEQRKNIKERFLPRFSQVAFLVQMPQLDIEDEIQKMKGSALNAEDKKEISYRSRYALNWLNVYAPEDYKYELREKEIPEAAKKLSRPQKEALKELLEYVKSQRSLDGQLIHTRLHEIKEQLKINPREFFSAIYLSFLGKESGPKAGWFLSVLDKKFLEKRLAEVIQVKE